MHVVGITAAVALGAVILAFAIWQTAPHEVPALIVYFVSLVAVLSVSMAYNLWPISPIKRWLARFDQAAIFLFIAGTYTPFLVVMGGTPLGSPIIGWIGEHLGPRWTLAVGGALTLVGVALAVAVYARLTGGWQHLVQALRHESRIRRTDTDDVVPEALAR